MGKTCHFIVILRMQIKHGISFLSNHKNKIQSQFTGIIIINTFDTIMGLLYPSNDAPDINLKFTIVIRNITTIFK